MKKPAAFAVLGIVGAGAVASYFWLARPVAEVYVAARGTAIAAVYGTVKVVPSLTIQVRARTGGILRFSPDLVAGKVALSLPIKQGQVLAEIVNEDLDRELRRAETDLKAAQERKQLGPPSEQELKTQEAQLARLVKLAELQNAPASEVERVRNYVQALHERVRSEQVELDRQLTVLTEQAGTLQDRKARCTLTAPVDGQLVAVNVINGEYLAEGTLPFTVATKTSYLEGQINEEDVGSVTPKMKAVARLYSYGDRQFDATVSQVLPTANNQRYTVTLTIDQPPDNLMSGMTGEMNIIAGKREGALIVPSRAVIADRVWVVKDGVIKPRSVKVGFRNIERSEITEGLQPGESVVVADHDLFHPGQHVRTVTVNQ